MTPGPSTQPEKTNVAATALATATDMRSDLVSILIYYFSVIS
jgi:hypothetical protein